MKNIEKIAEELFNKVRSRFEGVSIGDKNSKATEDPMQARFFNFNYVERSGTNYGSITISLIDEDSLKVIFSTSLVDQIDQNPEAQEEWYNFLRGLRFFAKRNLLKFDARDITKSNLTVRDLKVAGKATNNFDTESNPVTESKLYGTTKTSIQEFGGAKLVIKHSQAVNEEVPGARSRRIHSMFIETEQGERFLLPFKKLSAGRAMAEHVAHGGYVHDLVGKHIVGMVEEMNNLSFFVRGTRNRVFEDGETQDMVSAAVQRYHNLRLEMRNMGTKRGYQKFAESFQLEEYDSSDYDFDTLKERFVKKMFDDRMAQALPYVHRAYVQRSAEKSDAYVNEFEDWADRAAEISDSELKDLNDLMKNPITAGLEGIDAISAIRDIIEDEQLYREIENLSRTAGVDADARSLISNWAETKGYQLVYVPGEESEPNEPAEPADSEPNNSDTLNSNLSTASAEVDLKEMIRLAGL